MVSYVVRPGFSSNALHSPGAYNSHVLYHDPASLSRANEGNRCLAVNKERSQLAIAILPESLVKWALEENVEIWDKK